MIIQSTSGSLKKAKRLFHSKKFKDVVRLLEPEIFKYRESISFFKTLGISCVYSDDIGGATSYLTRALQLQKDDVDSLLGLAVVALKRMKTDEAIKHWLTVLEVEPGNQQANKGLALIRNKLDPDKLVDFVESGKIASVYPRVKSRPGFKILIACVVLGLLAATPFLIKAYVSSIPKKAVRPEVGLFVIPNADRSLIDLQGDFRYILSEDGVRKTFNIAKEHFLKYEDNLAIVEINRLLNSNAASGIKNIADNVKLHTIKPDFSSLKNNFSLSQVFIDPYLYTSCYVKWRGRIGSVAATKARISFYLWVGSEKDFEGVVPVFIEFPFDIQNGQVFDVLGQIVLEKGKVSLRGTALHRIITGISN